METKPIIKFRKHNGFNDGFIAYTNIGNTIKSAFGHTKTKAKKKLLEFIETI